MSSHFDRRAFLKLSSLLLSEAGLLAGLSQAQASEQAAQPQVAKSKVLTRIAFGSCAKQSKPQPIWDAVLQTKPEMFLFLGDNIYGDTRDMGVLSQKYDQFAAIPGVKKLRETVPHMAIWDDHDFGENDAGAEYPMKEESRKIFCDFWGVPSDSPRRTRDGVYTAAIIGRPGRRVQIIMPDLRFNRTPLNHLDLGGKKYEDWAKELEAAGKLVPGPYERNPDPHATMIGEQQWAWIEEQLRKPAEIRIFASSLQVLADFPGWEAWINYARDHDRLLELIRKTKANGVVFISGDTHYAELSKLDVNVPYPLYDLTSSGITEKWPVLPPNSLRVGEAIREANFGLIDIVWEKEPFIVMKALDVNGKVKIEHKIGLQELQVHC